MNTLNANLMLVSRLRVLCLLSWQHYMLAYRDSLAAVCTAQMNRKKRMQVWPC